MVNASVNDIQYNKSPTEKCWHVGKLLGRELSMSLSPKKPSTTKRPHTIAAKSIPPRFGQFLHATCFFFQEEKLSLPNVKRNHCFVYLPFQIVCMSMNENYMSCIYVNITLSQIICMNDFK